MKKNIIIARIAEGLGNQLFMFANAYAIAKSKKYSLMLDDESGYFKNKNLNFGSGKWDRTTDLRLMSPAL